MNPKVDKEAAASSLNVNRAAGSGATEWLMGQYLDIDRQFEALLSYPLDSHRVRS